MDTNSISPLEPNKKADLKKAQPGIYHHSVVFMGSNVKSNVDACNWLVRNLASTMPEITFVIIGNVCNSIGKSLPNVRPLGSVSNNLKNQILQLADVAINPVSEGAGTNVKMVEYLAAGLPIITTPVGGRGLGLTNRRDSIITQRENFKQSLEDMLRDSSLLVSISA